MGGLLMPRLRFVLVITVGFLSAVSSDIGLGQVRRTPVPRDNVPSRILKAPRLVVSDITLRPDDTGFKIFMAYKNVGNGGLPRASQMPVKPNYRVLIDNREIRRGDLFFPDAPTPPGWELPVGIGFFVGDINAWTKADKTRREDWRVGDSITVIVNENKALGMASHSMTASLREMALRFWYDLLVESVALEPMSMTVHIKLRIDGRLDLAPKKFYVSDHQKYAIEVKLKPGQRDYHLTQKVPLKEWEINHAVICFGVWAPGQLYEAPKDIDYRNNHWYHIYKRGRDYSPYW
jgi:hypothetical protein